MSYILRSRAFPFSANGRIPVDLAFLAPAQGAMKVPEISALVLRVNCLVDVAGAALAADDQCRALDDVRVRDQGGDRIALRGIELREVQLEESGSSYADPPALGIGLNQTMEFTISIPLSPARAARGADFRINVAELLNGGEILLGCPPAAFAANGTIVSGTYEVYATIVDGMHPEAKSRATWIAYNATNAEDYYPVFGALRSAFAIAPDTTGAASMTSIDTLDSTTLGYVAIPRTVLAEVYRQGSYSLDATVDNVTQGNCFSIVAPTRHGKQTVMPGAGRVHVRFSAAPPTNSRVVINAITDRVASNSRAILGGDLNKLAAETTSGRRAVTSLSSATAARLPVRVG
jgi:hypothetical protein